MRYLTTLLFLLATTVAGADSTITYQGQLQDTSGPVDATVDMSFALFENEAGGDPVGEPVPLAGVSVVGGLFQVALDFGDQDYASGLWLAIEVAGEPLVPRQAITGAPFAISAAPGSRSNWERSGSHIHYIDGRVGIGTSSPGAALDVVGSGKFGHLTTEAIGLNSFVTGGSLGFPNRAEGSRSFVGGGRTNTASGLDSFIGGGRDNTASGAFSFAAGRRAKAQHTGTFVWANDALSDFASTGADQFLIRAVGGVGIGTSSPGAALDVIGTATFGATSNQASGTFSFVGGGFSNTASALASFVGGGRQNTASGSYSFVAGGRDNIASGNYSFAAGRRAQAENNGQFVWADSLDFPSPWPSSPFLPEGENSFLARATGGVMFVSAVDDTGFPTAGVFLDSGGGSWQNLSDRNRKMAIAQVDPANVLENLMQMPISEYSYKSQDESIRHMGPMAQDFHLLFGLGENELMISAMNLAGIAVAAIQGLNVELDASIDRVSALETDKTELAERLAALEAENVELRQPADRNNALEARLAALEALLVEDRQVAGQPQ